MKTQSTWREFVESLTHESTFHTPASTDKLEEVESMFDILLPIELKSLLMESNGIQGSYGLCLIWEIERILKDNLFFRKYAEFKDVYMPFDHLLFFADAGTGDQFAFGIVNGKIQQSDIFVWNHENDSRQWVAPSLEIYLEWWLNGKIKI